MTWKDIKLIKMDMAVPKTRLYMTYDITLETSVEAFLQRK